MKKTKYLLLTLLITTTMLLGACNLPQGQSDKDADATTVAETAAAVFTHAAETAAATGPTATSPAPVPATATAIPTNTLFPTQAATATNTPIPCNRASFVKDVTISDNTNIDAGATFTKTWRLKNNGSCTWTSGYVLLFDSGDQMGAPATASITSGTVAPGATVDISIDLTAPASPGTYQGNFKLRSPDNIVFGINADGQGPFWVKIVVPNPTATPTATTVPKPDLYISKIEFSPAAPHMGDLITVKVSVYNGGNANAGAFTVEWYTANGGPLGCSWPVASLVHTGGYVLDCTYTYAGWSTYETRAIADSANTVAESDETNNTKTQTLIVGP
jgi:hypothetical protein